MSEPLPTQNSNASDPIDGGKERRGINIILDEIRLIGKKGTILETVAALEPLLLEIRTLVGVELSSVFKQFQGDRVGTLEDKREVASAMNDLFDSIGLRVKCPKTGVPTILIGHPRGDGLGDGRFQLRLSSRTPTLNVAALPEIELIPRDSRDKSRGLSR